MTKTITLRLDDEIYRLLKNAAKGEMRTISNFLEYAALKYVTDESFISNAEMEEILSKKSHLTTLKDEKNETDGFFIAIGHEANTDFLSNEIGRDKMGRIIADSLPAGMFVAGDVQAGQKMQIATAVGLGCNVSMDAIAFINSRM